jgi:hypothetical protein
MEAAMDTAMLLAAGLLHVQREPGTDSMLFAERQMRGARRLAARLACTLAAFAVAVAALDLAARNATTSTGECHDCIAELPAADGGADLARADTARSR